MKRILAALIFFAGFSAVPAAPALAQTDEAEIVFWQSVRNSKSPAELEAYLKTYPDGKFAPLARIRLEGLKSASPSTGSVETQTKTKIQAADEPSVHDCDRLAAHPLDPDKKAEGVTMRRLEADRAKRVCQAALATYPDVPRFTFQLGRAFHKDRALAEAIEQYRLAAEKGYAPAMGNLGIMYGSGLGVAKDERLAVSWYREAAGKGYAHGMTGLGRMYENGRGVAKDEREAARWYRKAADGGEVFPMYRLGVMYREGRGVERNLEEAARWYRKAAEKGNTLSMTSLGVMYAFGWGVPKDDVEAVHWYRKAAEKGSALAMLNLGKRYQVGRGVKKDLHTAASWYEKAAEAGNLDALSGIGYFYKHGKAGKPKDVAKALSLFREAADKGNATGRYNLGIMYEDGVGVAKDRREAVRLYRLAAAGDKRAAKRLERLGEPLYDLAEIQRLLTIAGFDAGTADGELGAQTRQAIRNYQRKEGLAVDGKPSVALLERLRKPTSVGSVTARKPAPTSGGGATAGSAAGNRDDLSDLNTLD